MKPTEKFRKMPTDRFPFDHGQLHRVLDDEREALSEWLEENAPYCAREEAHQNEGSRERAYWHLGYKEALNDIVAALERQGK